MRDGTAIPNVPVTQSGASNHLHDTKKPLDNQSGEDFPDGDSKGMEHCILWSEFSILETKQYITHHSAKA